MNVPEANQTDCVPGIRSSSVVDQGILQQCQEYEGDTNVIPNIDGLQTHSGKNYKTNIGAS